MSQINYLLNSEHAELGKTSEFNFNYNPKILLHACQPKELTVYGRYSRRGGLDINPYRSTQQGETAPNHRLCRQ